MLLNRPLVILIVWTIFSCNFLEKISKSDETSKNPIVKGWYADPEAMVFGDQYWIFPTFSARYKDQVFLDAFSSKDLIQWEKHPRVLDTSVIKWAKQAIWAPSIIEKNNLYYLFFSANDLQKSGGPYWNEKNNINHYGGIGIAVANAPSGPYKDYLGKPLIDQFYNEAQPIDQFVFKDIDDTYYMFYGGWRHCNLAQLNDDFTGFISWDNDQLFKEITPDGYVEGPFVFRRKNRYYFMWSEGNWGNDTYKVAYAMADKVSGPYNRVGTILETDKNIATGAGHNSVINTPNTDQWYIVYHRRPIPNQGRDHRVICIDKLEFNKDGTIKQVKMTFEGVKSNKVMGH
ncbi:MAG: arabinan endo-1,5-alpha-L-arabinosidase [Flavobacteriaceae bacterium TMED42]|nr:MAG: arabinan endo-1,5-alpha-L-arabinosidase [Flavobacteriaceae bacterium TMED42]|tara:strand:- start:543 stop:1574 length:1032 start_codon:yes stop_codon:yes gene_type:complete